jgi:CSLREA domain-containing protein
MNINPKNILTVASLALSTLASTQISADLFLVNSTDDPSVGNPAACVAGSTSCSLRDALAAADSTPHMDTIIFDVPDTIYLQKALTANTPVEIDGGGNTTIRVDQRYAITTLEDRPVFGGGDVLVLQPVYFSNNSSLGAMLNLLGAGSVVENTIFDGSISPQATDLGVERVDYDSNDTTDYILYTVSTNDNDGAARWPIAGGITALYSTIVRDNVVSNLAKNAISVEFSSDSVVTGNTITGGAAGQPGYAVDGISVYSAIFTTVAGNSVKGFRNGVTFNTASGVEIIDNHLTGNVDGLELDSVGTPYGAVLIQENEITGNLENGILVRWSEGAQVHNNEVNHNFERGIHIKGAGEISITNNDANHNGNGEMDHGGILINEGSGLISVKSNHASHNQGFGVVVAESHGNILDNNEVVGNTGAGIILLNGSQWNQLQANTVKKNYVGVISGLDGDPLFPSNNLFQGNQLISNTVLDALDYDPDCNDQWLANTIGSSASVSSGCIDQ